MSQSLKIGGAALVAGLAAIIIARAFDDPDPDETRDFKTLIEARSAGVGLGFDIYRFTKSDGGRTRADGGPIFLAVGDRRDGGRIAIFLADSPCARRFPAVPGALCRRRIPLPDGGVRIVAADPMHVMQDGEWAGAGCTPAPCVVFAGDADDDDGGP